MIVIGRHAYLFASLFWPAGPSFPIYTTYWTITFQHAARHAVAMGISIRNVMTVADCEAAQRAGVATEIEALG
jgi:hypothetical protein